MTGLLALAALMLPAAKRFNFPYTVLLAAVGLAVGLLATAAPDRGLGPVTDFLGALHDLEITADAVLFIFLPALVFEAALALDVRRLIDDIAPILFLAVLGLLISTVLVALSLSSVSGMGLVACLMLGAIVSATDPVAVVAIFKEVGAPKRLAILVEGESLFNDATAIVAFTILAGMLAGESNPSVLGGVTTFLEVFIGGVVVGFLLARGAVWIFARVHRFPLVVHSLTIGLAYLSFIVAEHYLHFSGVMAVVTAALVVGSRGRTVIRPHDWHGLHETWEQIGFWANSLIFLLVGLAVPGIMKDIADPEIGIGWLAAVGWLAVLLVSAFVARALVIFGLVPLVSRLRLASEVSTAFKSLMFWGGLRGAVSLALALLVIENPAYPSEIRVFVGVLVTGFVLFTLFVNAPTIPVLIRLFGLDQLSKVESAVRDRALALAHEGVGQGIEAIATRQQASGTIATELVGDYRRRAETSGGKLATMVELSGREMGVVGLTALVARERRSYSRQFEGGSLSSETYRQLVRQMDDIGDALKAEGPAGYRRAAHRALGFDWRFHLALRIHRSKLGWSTPLSRRLAERFEALKCMRLALGEVADESLARIAPVVGDVITAELRETLEQRLDEVNGAINALELQYPEYAQALERQHLTRAALRLEAQSYARMLADAAITEEVYQSLQQHVDSEARRQAIAPELDLGLEAERLVGKVPLFRDLGSAEIGEIARLLRPRLAIPEETVVRKGDTADAMYFVSSGSLRVELEDETVELGTGDFFGEIALVQQQPRNANVVATCFCDLLTLYTADFERLLERNPRVRETIERVAAERLS